MAPAMSPAHGRLNTHRQIKQDEDSTDAGYLDALKGQRAFIKKVKVAMKQKGLKMEQQKSSSFKKRKTQKRMTSRDFSERDSRGWSAEGQDFSDDIEESKADLRKRIKKLMQQVKSLREECVFYATQFQAERAAHQYTKNVKVWELMDSLRLEKERSNRLIAQLKAQSQQTLSVRKKLTNYLRQKTRSVAISRRKSAISFKLDTEEDEEDGILNENSVLLPPPDDTQIGQNMESMLDQVFSQIDGAKSEPKREIQDQTRVETPLSRGYFQGSVVAMEKTPRKEMERHQRAVRWTPNDNRTRCEVCGQRFVCLLRRKHHCRSCGGLVCDECSRRREFAIGYGDRRVRTCERCYSDKQRKRAFKKDSIYSMQFIKD